MYVNYVVAMSFVPEIKYIVSCIALFNNYNKMCQQYYAGLHSGQCKICM